MRGGGAAKEPGKAWALSPKAELALLGRHGREIPLRRRWEEAALKEAGGSPVLPKAISGSCGTPSQWNPFHTAALTGLAPGLRPGADGQLGAKATTSNPAEGQIWSEP